MLTAGHELAVGENLVIAFCVPMADEELKHSGSELWDGDFKVPLCSAVLLFQTAQHASCDCVH
jgi:hypothetical protein